MDLIITILPVVTKDLPISPRFTPFLSRCKFSTLTTRKLMVEFYFLTFPRFPLRKKEHKSYFGKNRTHELRTSRCAGYLLDHSGDFKDKISSWHLIGFTDGSNYWVNSIMSGRNLPVYRALTLIAMYGHTYSKTMDQPGKVANPARGQLNRKNEHFLVRVRA